MSSTSTTTSSNDSTRATTAIATASTSKDMIIMMNASSDNAGPKMLSSMALQRPPDLQRVVAMRMLNQGQIPVSSTSSSPQAQEQQLLKNMAKDGTISTSPGFKGSPSSPPTTTLTMEHVDWSALAKEAASAAPTASPPSPIASAAVSSLPSSGLPPTPDLEYKNLNDDQSTSSASGDDDPQQQQTVGRRPSKRRSTGSNKDDQVLKGITPDCFVKEQEEEDLCTAIQNWKPFVNKVATYMMKEHLPFEYFDVWVPHTALLKNKAASEEEDDRKNNPDTVPSSSTSISTTTTTNTPNLETPVRLCHVGHGTNDAAELSCIFTMYQMNQFGKCTEKYSFPPGVGLPGRVFRSKRPMWDNALQEAPFRDFPRTELAKQFGLKQGLAIPLALPAGDAVKGAAGNVIIAMYATNFVERNDALVQQAARALVQDTTLNLMSLRQLEQHQDYDQSYQQYRQAILPDATEVEMANRLAKHYNLGETNCFPLVCLLWKAPCNRSDAENNNLQRLKKLYHLLVKNEEEGKKEQQQQQKQQQGDDEKTQTINSDGQSSTTTTTTKGQHQPKQGQAISDNDQPPSPSNNTEEEKKEEQRDSNSTSSTSPPMDEHVAAIVSEWDQLMLPSSPEDHGVNQLQKSSTTSGAETDKVAVTIVTEWDRLLKAC